MFWSYLGGGAWLLLMTSPHLPDHSRPGAACIFPLLLSVVVQAMHGFERSNGVQVVDGQGEAGQHGGLDGANDRKNPRLRSAKAPFRGRVGRLDDVPPSHVDAPRRGPKL
jgi:hypothetical protein